MKRNKIVQVIYIYLYRYLGEPRYVGQSPDVERRDKRHIKDRKSSFEKFMAEVGRDKFTLEIIAQVDDIPIGPLACALENEMMEKFRTYRPSVYGFNQAKVSGLNASEDVFKAKCAAIGAALKGRISPTKGMKLGPPSEEKRRKISCSLTGRHLSEEHKVAIGRGGKGKGSGESNPMSKLTKIQVEEIRKRYQEGETQIFLSKEFKVHHQTIFRIIHGLRWPIEVCG